MAKFRKSQSWYLYISIYIYTHTCRCSAHAYCWQMINCTPAGHTLGALTNQRLSVLLLSQRCKQNWDISSRASPSLPPTPHPWTWLTKCVCLVWATSCWRWVVSKCGNGSTQLWQGGMKTVFWMNGMCNSQPPLLRGNSVHHAELGKRSWNHITLRLNGHSVLRDHK